MRIFPIILTLCLCSIAFVDSTAEVMEFEFYSERIRMEYDDAMLDLQLSNTITESTITQYYEQLQHETQYFVVMGVLFHYKKTLGLNDWLYYRLIDAAAREIYKDKHENHRLLFTWFILNKSGYMVQLNYAESTVNLSVYSEEMVYDMPIRKAGSGYFVDISAYQKEGFRTRMINNDQREFKVRLKGKPFSFVLDRLPTFTKKDLQTKTYEFIHDNESYRMSVDMDRSMVQIMYLYPELSIDKHALIPLSDEARNSLFSALGKMIEGKNDFESVRLLLSFTRQFKTYKTDKEAYEIDNLTFSPEETLFYKFSDCEDRSILFRLLVEQLLGKETILLDYEDHATVAVNFDNFDDQNAILYKGKKYSICEPTGPGNHLQPGQFPEGFQKESFNIID